MKKTHEWRYYARATWTDGRLYTGVYLLPVKTKTPEAAAAGGGGGDDKPPVDDADVERMMKQMKDGPEKTGKGLSLSGPSPSVVLFFRFYLALWVMDDY